MNDGRGLVVRPPCACAGETTENAGIPPDLMPVVVVYDDAEILALSNLAITNALPRIQDMAQDDRLFVDSLMAAFTQTSSEAARRLNEFMEKKATRIAPSPAGSSARIHPGAARRPFSGFDKGPFCFRWREI
ncbi:hypothetical protein AB7714_06175 [Tardiphaga sp. 1201_B9_N1_1]|uniref:hypothetical protein n=1 Tax=unclassified Tardiphaga TaxID=2631404 RepID=UPI003F236057